MPLPYETIAEDSTTRFGLVVLQADEVIEGEFPGLLTSPDAGEAVRLHVSRVPSAHQVTPETLAAMEAELPAAVALLPEEARFDVIGYACTSGAKVIGEEKVAGIIRALRPGVAVSNPLTAAKAALKALKVRRLGFVTPYVAAVSSVLRDDLESAGFEIGSFGSFEVAVEGIVARMTPQSVLEAIVQVGSQGDCGAVFAACTNLRAAGVIAEAEARLGKPVISSNQALAWHMLRLAGIATPWPGRGRLFTRPLLD
ncbi:MAG: aspartate/glutamate racemase family protein [Kiloniellaceae bacterium]